MRGEGNHKIPGSFAPENMEKTGAERVKYSLACQHEDAIPIKFVSYAQKCPTVLCTFAVALRKESVDRNASSGVDFSEDWLNAGSLSRDADGVYLVDSIDYIIDYATDAINGSNSDIEGKLDADLVVL